MSLWREYLYSFSSADLLELYRDFEILLKVIFFLAYTYQLNVCKEKENKSYEK